eukprot:scaffold3236_cov66-Cylindrotheca_fusiformis.AAC.13
MNSQEPFVYTEDTRRSIIPDDITHIRIDPSVTTIHGYERKRRDAWPRTLLEVHFVEGRLKHIQENAFAGSNLRDIHNLPTTLEVIGDHAFDSCEKLWAIALPPSLQVIGKWAFFQCERLTRVDMSSPNAVIGKFAFANCSRLVDVNLPHGVTQIAESCFSCCFSLEQIQIPSSVVKIGEDAFYMCSRLKKLNLPTGLQSIECTAFGECSSLTLGTESLPSSLLRIEKGAFNLCESLNAVKFPARLEHLGCSAFQGCTGLSRIGANCLELAHLDLPAGLQSIWDYAFCGCSSLTHVRVPSSVKRIECGAFGKCSKLTSLELPEQLEMIDLVDWYEYDESVSVWHADNERHFPAYPSLVNVAIPLHQLELPFDVEDMTTIDLVQFRNAANHFADHFERMKHRFDTLPLHRLCYYQSHYPMSTVREALDEIVGLVNPPASGIMEIDMFGMTPLHILALSHTPNVDLMQDVLKVYQYKRIDRLLLEKQDKFGSTPMDYLCMNHTSASASAIQWILETTVQTRLPWLDHFPRCKSSIDVAMKRVVGAEWSLKRKEVGHMRFEVAKFDRLESLSLVELALWKMALCQTSERKCRQEDHLEEWKAVQSDTTVDENAKKRIRLENVSPSLGPTGEVSSVKADRKRCRIRSGAHVVIPHILPFVGNVCAEDYLKSDD